MAAVFPPFSPNHAVINVLYWDVGLNDYWDVGLNENIVHEISSERSRIV